MDTSPFARAFGTCLTLPEMLDPHLEEALRHILDNPGSMVRPRMVYQGCIAYEMNEECAEDMAIALECFHTASLVFDDLPCMDDATERRGVPCVHIAYGEAGAILTALALINRAYALIWKAASGSPQANQKQALAYVEQRLGVAGLLNGQSMDLHYSNLPHSHETTEWIARGKTVSLIQLTLVLPAILSGASARETQLLERLSLYWGLGYQMVDDLKDVLDSAVESGKTVARDLLLDRPNVATVLGVPQTVARLTRFIQLGDKTLGVLLKSKPTMSFLENLRTSLQEELMRVTENASDISVGARL
jgi:geranylgeranyl pyrophosphate synthase